MLQASEIGPIFDGYVAYTTAKIVFREFNVFIDDKKNKTLKVT